MTDGTTQGKSAAPSLIPDPAKQARFYPEYRDSPPAGTFELGLVLGGTVSAGAYTAGALDILVQALDSWYERSQNAPPHNILLSCAGGTSGGAACSALLSVLSNRAFEHIPGDQTALSDVNAPRPDNRFWNMWVDDFQFSKVADTSDIGTLIIDGPGFGNKQRVPALLNAQMMDQAVVDMTAYAQQPGQKERPWIAKPLRVAITVANLRGIPYQITDIPMLGDYTGNSLVQHDDFAWFAVPNWLGTEEGEPEKDKRPDEFWLSRLPVAGLTVEYATLPQWAVASGAMPIGLKARTLNRPAEQYVYRPRPRATDTKAIVDWPQPDWSELPEVLHGEPYTFSGVDGGSFNNDPVRLVHAALAGSIGRNPRSSSDANRAILLIDPLVDKPSDIKPTGISLIEVVKSIVDAYIKESRYLTADLELFADPNIFSRFQLVPNRTVDEKEQVGEAALAGTDFFALGGWCARAFRVHDFLLGRANMAQYLRSELNLSGDNPLFHNWEFYLRADYAMEKDGTRKKIDKNTPTSSYYLPVIPLPPDNFSVTVPDWPVNALDPSNSALILGPLKKRLEAVLKQFREDNLSGLLPWLLSLFLIDGVADNLAETFVKEFTAALKERGLLS